MPIKRAPSKIFPKVSTLPRQRTEAAQYLDMYKLTVEKKRIQEEIGHIDQRRQRLQARLAEIDRQIDTLNNDAATIRHREDQHLKPGAAHRPGTSAEPMPSSNVYLPERRSQPDSEDFKTVVLDY